MRANHTVVFMQKAGGLYITGLVRILDNEKMLNPSYYMLFRYYFGKFTWAEWNDTLDHIW